jgi:short-subunit dehydrogenase
LKYANQTVFIIGGSSGIGLAAAHRFASEGANLALFARRPEALEAAAKDLTNAAPHHPIQTFVLDASDFHETAHVLGQAQAQLGTPDILINSAGGATPRRFVDIDHAQLEATIAANLLTAWNPCQVLVPHMQAQGSGIIVNVSSVAGLLGVYGYTDYSLAKFGLIGFSESLRSELKPKGIRVQVLCPPDTDTPGFEQENKSKPKETMALSQGAKLMSADAVADVLLKEIGGKKFIILANQPSRIFYALRRLSARLTFAQIDRIIAQAQNNSF